MEGKKIRKNFNVTEIRRRTGVSRQTIYQFFEGNEDDYPIASIKIKKACLAMTNEAIMFFQGEQM